MRIDVTKPHKHTKIDTKSLFYKVVAAFVIFILLSIMTTIVCAVLWLIYRNY